MSQQIEINIPTCYEKVWSFGYLRIACSCRFHHFDVHCSSRIRRCSSQIWKVHKTVDPGLRFKLPFGIDNVMFCQSEDSLSKSMAMGRLVVPMTVNLLRVAPGVGKRVW